MGNNEKLMKINQLKKIVLEGGINNIEDVEPTIFTIIEDLFGLVNQYKEKANKIKSGGTARIAKIYGVGSSAEVLSYKFKEYLNLIKQMEIYIKMCDDRLLEDIKESTLHTESLMIAMSYCWQDTELANSIDDYLRENGVEVKRDVRDVDNWTSLKEFMESLKEQKYVVLLISDSYLKSSNCMFEVLEIMKTNYQSKILPVIINSEIYSTEKHIEYISYWETKAKELKTHIDSLEYINSLEVGFELKKSVKISQSIGEFLKVASDLKTPELENVAEVILDHIQK